MDLIDISPTISPRIAVFPGDVAYTGSKMMRIREGAHLDLGSMQATFHLGAHTDAPIHYHRDGADIARVPLDAYYGPCDVIEVKARRGERFDWDDLVQRPTAPRLLFKTGTYPDPEAWSDDFAAPAPELIDRLGRDGVVLVGFDTPSTDLADSKGLPSHQMLFRHGMANLEGLVLAHVRPGRYTIAAFPLKIEDGDGSPVRAVLIVDER